MNIDNTIYPKIFLPAVFEKISTSKPQLLPPQQPIKPKEPEPIKHEPPKSGCMPSFLALILLIGGVLGLFSAFGEKTEEGTAILISLIVSLIGAVALYSNFKNETEFTDELPKLKKQYEEDKLKYSKKLQQYQKDLQIYSNEQINYKEALKKIQQPENIFKHRCNLLENHFSTLRRPTSNSASNFHQQYKSFLENYLLRIFKNIITSENSVSIITDSKWLIIDIKIDVPYDINSGDILSFTEVKSLNSSTDRITIVFAEEQIILQPKCCIEFIERIIFHLQHLISFDHVCMKGSVIKAWTKEAAIKMAFKRFRDTYRKYDFNEYVSQRAYFNIFKDELSKPEINESLEPIDDLPF